MTRRHAGFVTGLAFLLHAPSFFKPFMDIDEGSLAGIACRLVGGGSVYRDGAENKTPGIFYIYKSVFALFGRYNMVAIHIAVTLSALCTALIVGAIAKRYAKTENAGYWAAIFYVIFSAAYYPKMLAGNTEMFAVLPGALCVWCYLRARDTRWSWFIAAGACGALALVCKQVALATFCAVLADRALTGWREPLRALRDLALLFAGFAAIVIAIVLHLRSIGVLDDAAFWTWTYVVRYYIPSGNNDHSFVFNLATCFVPFVATVSPLVYLAVRGRARRLSAIYWWLGGNVAASLVGGRMYGHYFLLWVPALCALAGIGASIWSTRERKLVIAACTAIAIGFFGYAVVFEGATDSAFTPDPDYREASRYVRDHTDASDRIFVWGWFPALYQAADRCPSTRFVYTHILSGKGANAGAALGHNVPEAWDMLMHDLEAAPPPYILDTSTGDYNYHSPPEDYPRLWEFIASRYDVATTIAGVRIFHRRS